MGCILETKSDLFCSFLSGIDYSVISTQQYNNILIHLIFIGNLPFVFSGSQHVTVAIMVRLKMSGYCVNAPFHRSLSEP